MSHIEIWKIEQPGALFKSDRSGGLEFLNDGCVYAAYVPMDLDNAAELIANAMPQIPGIGEMSEEMLRSSRLFIKDRKQAHGFWYDSTRKLVVWAGKNGVFCLYDDTDLLGCIISPKSVVLRINTCNNNVQEFYDDE